MDIRIVISYVVVCLFYSLCRMHYLLVVKKDDEINQMLGELIDYSGDKNIVKVFVVFQILLCPILDPLGVIKHLYRFFTKSE